MGIHKLPPAGLAEYLIYPAVIFVCTTQAAITFALEPR
jgi:hypothetical protein